MKRSKQIKSGRAVLETGKNIEELMSMREVIFQIRNRQEYDLMPASRRKEKDKVWRNLNKILSELESVATIIYDEMPNNFEGIKEMREEKQKYTD